MILKHILVALILLSIGVNIYSHLADGFLNALAAYFSWSTQGRAVVDSAIGIVSSIGAALATVIDTRAVLRSWGVALGLTQPSNTDKIEAAQKQAVAAGVPKEDVTDLRAKNTEAIVAQIAVLNPPDTGAAPLPSLKNDDGNR